MNCDDARRLIGAEPGRTSLELAEHLQGCPACAAFQREMITLEAQIERALAQAPTLRARQSRLPAARSGWALAASVLVALFAGITLWSLRPAQGLAHEVVEHVKAEPMSWASSDSLAPQELADELRKSGLALAATPDSVVYARSCWFRGHFVPHFVVRTARGLVTVMVLRHEKGAKRENFHADGFAGVIVPAQQGSYAIVARGGTIDASAVADALSAEHAMFHE